MDELVERETERFSPTRSFGGTSPDSQTHFLRPLGLILVVQFTSLPLSEEGRREIKLGVYAGRPVRDVSSLNADDDEEDEGDADGSSVNVCWKKTLRGTLSVNGSAMNSVYDVVSAKMNAITIHRSHPIFSFVGGLAVKDKEAKGTEGETNRMANAVNITNTPTGSDPSEIVSGREAWRMMRFWVSGIKGGSVLIVI